MCQNSRLVEGFHPLFHESVVGPLFVGVRGGTIWLKHAPGITWQGEEKKLAASSKMTVRQQLL